ncbi:hypothetical protein EST38_g8983 [Candolleomyces aberdarensis]|uniref:Uncharacterized protein n=1 Tax=Candolleomyces aberdarensis TaxID=2316362 RepID=A0A4Q2DBW5_9AGAR|nr:hypothetical protein EST38_g8983 [Candolleomyces aberdarensis]
MYSPSERDHHHKHLVTAGRIEPERIQLFPVLKKVETPNPADWRQAYGSSLKKPEALLSAGIAPKSNWKHFVPNNQTTLQPDGVPCRKY